MAAISGVNYKNTDSILAAINNGDIDPYSAMAYLNEQSRKWSQSHLESPLGPKINPYYLSEQNEKLYNNLLSRYVSQNSLNWQAEQLQALGLSNAGVLQTGAAHTALDQSNVASSQNNRATSLANSLISMAGRMAASGIYGSSLAAVKGAAGQAATLAAHSASPIMKDLKPYKSTYSDDEMMDFFAKRDAQFR